jgi:hypothetical protein
MNSFDKTENFAAFRTMVTHWWKLELDKALELADETLALAEKVKDPAMLLTKLSARRDPFLPR